MHILSEYYLETFFVVLKFSLALCTHACLFFNILQAVYVAGTDQENPSFYAHLWVHDKGKAQSG